MTFGIEQGASMSLNHWLLFASVVLAVIVMPGPAAALCLSHGVAHGPLRTLVTVLGLVLSSLALIVFSLAGLGAVLASSATLFDVIKYVGAAYLIYLGISIWRSPPGDALASRTPDAAPLQIAPLGKLFRTGFLVGISNPKDLLFFGALFPQFIDTKASVFGQVAILGATWCVFAFAVMSVYAAVGAKLAKGVDALNARGIFNRITGGVFIAAGGALAWVKRADA
jgi:homoserine/homoserine lactone efflux protein